MESKTKSKKLQVFEDFNRALAENVGIKFTIAKGKHIPVREDDTFIVSYPRSGNRFCRMLLCGVMYPNEEIRPDNITNWSPGVYGSNKKIKHYHSPRILKSHDYFNPNYNKIVYLVRDPRSVAVSYFHFLKKNHSLSTDCPFSDYLPYFLKGEVDPYGSWAEHVGSWLGACGFDSERFLLIRYENLRQNTTDELKKILKFLNIEYDDQRIENALNQSSFEKVRSQEYQKKHQQKSHVDENELSIRKGNIAEWKTYFGEQEQKMLIDAFGPVMEQVGYYQEDLS